MHACMQLTPSDTVVVMAQVPDEGLATLDETPASLSRAESDPTSLAFVPAAPVTPIDMYDEAPCHTLRCHTALSGTYLRFKRWRSSSAHEAHHVLSPAVVGIYAAIVRFAAPCGVRHRLSPQTPQTGPRPASPRAPQELLRTVAQFGSNQLASERT